MSLSKLWEIVKDREPWHPAIHEAAKSWTWLSTEKQGAPLVTVFKQISTGRLGHLFKVTHSYRGVRIWPYRSGSTELICALSMDTILPDGPAIWRLEWDWRVLLRWLTYWLVGSLISSPWGAPHGNLNVLFLGKCSFIYFFFNFWLCWVFLVAHGLCLAVVSGRCSFIAVCELLIVVASLVEPRL